jgi:extracellular factor (EF) 3-hydroxypalmitic acid methyl ester biosynthesis protein
MENVDQKESLVTFRTSQEIEVRATLLSLTPYAATFEVYSPETVIRTSEVLEAFQVLLGDETVYSGRAVVRDAVNTGTVVVCSALLDDLCFDTAFFASVAKPAQLRPRFHDFVQQWQKVCKVLPEFKVVVADIQTFLIDLRRWLEQVELGLRSSPMPDREPQERAVIAELSPLAIPAIDALFDKFENIAGALIPETCPVHRSYVQRHLHPIVLCAPFAYRSYRKPLGYAGDYETVNMMLRDPQEGSSLFAKVFNVWLLHQGSAAAHRNRIEFLKNRLVEEAARAVRAQRETRILNLGCGPACEIQGFLAQSELSNHARFTLMDFNDETLSHVSQRLRQTQQRHQRGTKIELVKKSVQQLLRDLARAQGASDSKKYDLIYCAGLFDYLPDRTCRRLMTVFYGSLAPGGLLLATNVAPVSPNRSSLELILDWNLVYRDAANARALRPEGVSEDEVRVLSDDTGINLFVEVRKPDAAG